VASELDVELRRQALKKSQENVIGSETCVHYRVFLWGRKSEHSLQEEVLLNFLRSFLNFPSSYLSTFLSSVGASFLIITIIVTQ
jgi:hypothetical protein